MKFLNWLASPVVQGVYSIVKVSKTGLALLYDFVPYQRRAKNADKCGVEVQGGKLPTNDWFLNLQILTSGGFL